MMFQNILKNFKNFLRNKKFYLKTKTQNKINKRNNFKNYVVTGGNSGIGLELVKILLKNKKTVLATYNTSSSSLDDLKYENLYKIKCDFENFDEIKNLEKNEKFCISNVLINCAATRGKIPERNQDFFDLNYSDLFRTFKVNALSLIEVCKALINSKNKQAKIILNLSSYVASNKKNKSGGMYIYRPSKNLLNSISKNLSIDIKKYLDCKIIILHPGNVKTKMNPIGELKANLVAERIFNITCDSKILELDGEFIDLNMQLFPW